MEERLPVNFGPPKKTHRRKKAIRKPAALKPVDPTPAVIHTPGQTFHPEAATSPAKPETVATRTKRTVIEPLPVANTLDPAPEILDIPKRASKLPIAAKSSLGKRLGRELLWAVVILLLIVVAGLGYIYFRRI